MYAWHDKEGGNPEVSLEIEGTKEKAVTTFYFNK
jgi:hypothetical protein